MSKATPTQLLERARAHLADATQRVRLAEEAVLDEQDAERLAELAALAREAREYPGPVGLADAVQRAADALAEVKALAGVHNETVRDMARRAQRLTTRGTSTLPPGMSGPRDGGVVSRGEGRALAAGGVRLREVDLEGLSEAILADDVDRAVWLAAVGEPTPETVEGTRWWRMSGGAFIATGPQEQPPPGDGEFVQVDRTGREIEA